MADDVTAPGAGETFATDQIGDRHFPKGKLVFGPDQTATDVTTSTPLPVLATLAAGQTVALDAPTLAALEIISVAGVATETTLAALSAKLAALESGRAPVAVQRLGTTTRAYGYADGQRLTTVGAGQVRSTAVAATEVLVHSSVRGFIRVGDSTVSASVGPGSIPLAADEKFHLQITSGQFVSFIRDGASDGSLTIMPVA